MRLYVIGGALLVAAGLVAAPLLAVRSSSNSDHVADAGPAPVQVPVREPGSAPLGPDGRPPMQVRDVKPRDGGPEVVYVGDRIGNFHGAVISDAGPGAAAAPAQSASAAQTASTAELQAQIAALQARQAAMQQQQSSTQEQTQLLRQMNDQLTALNQQMSQAQQARAEQQAAAAAQQQQTQQAIQGLGPALDMLVSGNGQISDALDAADQVFPPQARRDLAAARDAITNSNLGEARAFILQAIGDAQSGR